MPKKDVLRIEGYVVGKKVIEKKFFHIGVDHAFTAVVDDNSLVADGADSTRVVLRVTDEFGNQMRYSTAAISLFLAGPAEIIGDNPFSLGGGCGAVWIRARQEPETALLKAVHPVLGAKAISIQISPAEAERV